VDRLIVESDGRVRIPISLANGDYPFRIKNSTNNGNYAVFENEDGDEIIQFRSNAGKHSIVKFMMSDGQNTFVSDSGSVKVGSGTSEVDASFALLVVGDMRTTGFLQVEDVTAPGNPAAGEGRIYKKTGDDGIFWKPDAAGAEVDLTATGISAPTVTEVSATDEVTTSSTSYVLIPGMTITPGAGTYWCTFSSSGRGEGNNQELQIALFDNGTKVGHSERDVGFESGSADEDKRMVFHTQAKITVGAGEAIEARFNTNPGTVSIHMLERSLTVMKVT